ncbi:MAG: hypothetical protein ACJ75B_01385 [Flavisolibacter sp.]
MEDVPIAIVYKGKKLNGFAVPLARSEQDYPSSFDIIVDKAFLGTLRHSQGGWTMDTNQESELVEALGHCVMAWYDSETSPENGLNSHHSSQQH